MRLQSLSDERGNTMNTESTFSVKQVNLGSSNAKQISPASPPSRASRFRRIARFLYRAGIGGALGGYVLLVGLVLDEVIEHPPGHFFIPLLVILAFPFYMLAGFALAVVTSALTLFLEDLIEEKMTLLARAIVMSVFSVIVLLGVKSIGEQLEWVVVKQMLLPGLALGFPAGLLATANMHPGKRLIYGSRDPVGIRDLEANPIFLPIGMIAGMALRLVGVIGLMVSILALPVFWTKSEIHERLVMAYAIYYFAATAFVSLFIRSRGVVVAAAAFLNALLLVLAMYWEPSGGVESPLPMALFVLATLWLMFIGTWARPVRRGQLKASYQEN